MWLARLFGGRQGKEKGVAPRVSDSPAPPVKRSPSIGNARRGIHADKVSNKAKSGFDPYNSGSFERGNAWERVIRR
jgi:hypothetical protein